MKAIIVFCLFQISIATTVTSLDQDGYWRDYRGILPYDTYIAGLDSNQRRIGIGTVYIENGGLYIGTLYDGNQNIIVTGAPQPKFNMRNTRIKVLCTQSPENYEWRAIKSSQLGDLAYLAVQGGFENEDEGILYIGRTTYKGQIKVGKVIGYSPNDNYGKLYYFNGTGEGSTTSYELLIRRQNFLTQNFNVNITDFNYTYVNVTNP